MTGCGRTVRVGVGRTAPEHPCRRPVRFVYPGRVKGFTARCWAHRLEYPQVNVGEHDLRTPEGLVGLTVRVVADSAFNGETGTVVAATGRTLGVTLRPGGTVLGFGFSEVEWAGQ
jgi:hypothetical protein